MYFYRNSLYAQAAEGETDSRAQIGEETETEINN